MDGISRLRALYPFVDVSELPRAWSSKDKANYISLSENNLKVHYKGVGKGHKDAAAVRATHHIPAACLLYYYEIKIISKGRDGYMGIGLAAQEVNMQRLPGWDKQSYGYHGDDGHSFCSSGTGIPYGPTFTTGDIVGCGYNLVESTCFYTKNGLNLGRAFSDLPPVELFPTVGLQVCFFFPLRPLTFSILQTLGEEVEANFGMEQFCYDIEDDLKALRQRISQSVMDYPVGYNEWQTTVHKLVQSWLVHNGYCSTAEVFSSVTRQPFTENVSHIKQRLKIQQLVLSGRIADAIHLTDKLYPNVLKENPNLLFSLKTRQFVEMISGPGEKDHHASNGHQNHSHDCNGNGTSLIEEMETDDEQQSPRELHLPAILQFGKELQNLSEELKEKYGANEQNKRMLKDAFSLLAYRNLHESPVAWLLNPSEREVVCQQLNNAIVIHEMGASNHRPALETIIKHTKSLLPHNGQVSFFNLFTSILMNVETQCGAWLLEKL